MPKRFLVLDLATGAVDAAITAAVESAIAASVASNILKITVDDEASRYALTPAQAQNGDYVYQTDTATLYEVIDQTLLNGAAGYVTLATVTAAQISDASAAGRALLTGNVSIGSGADAVTLQTSGATLLQLPASGRLGTSSVQLTNHQSLNGTTLVTGVKYGVRQDGYNSAYAYLPMDAAAGDVIELEDIEGQWGHYSFTLNASGQYLNNNWYGSLVCAAPFSRVRALYAGNGYWTVSVEDPGKFTEIGWDGNSSLYPVAGNRWSMTYPASYSIYLPSGGSEGDEILIRDGGSNWSSYGIWLYGNSTYLNGSWAGSFYSNTSGATIRCVYQYDSSIGQLGWKVALVVSTGDPVWTEDSSGTNYFYAQAGQRFIFTYTPPGDALYTYLPSSPTLGDEIWIADGGLVNLPHGYSWQRKPGDEIWLADPGQNWGAFPIYIQMPNGSYGGGGDVINGAAVPFYVDRPGGKIRCVYVDDSTGWTVTYADEGHWRTGVDSAITLYPNGRYSCAFSASRTLTLPRPDYQNLQPGDEILIEDAGIAGTNGWATHALTIDNASQNINGAPNSKTVATNGATVRCLWVGGGTGWSVKTLPGTVI